MNETHHSSDANQELSGGACMPFILARKRTRVGRCLIDQEAFTKVALEGGRILGLTIRLGNSEALCWTRSFSAYSFIRFAFDSWKDFHLKLM